MLEHQRLWLQPWCDHRRRSPALGIDEARGGPPLWAVNADSEPGLVGVVRRRASPSAWVWFGSIAWPLVEVLEQPDESLLFTLDRYVGFRASWLVRDADGQRVGTIRGHEVRDATGLALGGVRWDKPGRTGRWLGMGGQPLGTLTRSRDGLEVVFGAELQDEPLARMLFLATLLRDED